jgi:hypothetical protein
MFVCHLIPSIEIQIVTKGRALLVLRAIVKTTSKLLPLVLLINLMEYDRLWDRIHHACG